MREPMYSREAYRIDSRGRKTPLWGFTLGIASELIDFLPTLIQQMGRVPSRGSGPSGVNKRSGERWHP